MTTRAWPATLDELKRQQAIAEAKYRPLVAVLAPAELIGLVNVVKAELAILRSEANQNALLAGHRPPGTRIGNR